MRKIQTRKDKSRKEKRNRWIIGGILIFFMLGSTFGVIVNSFGENGSAERIKYNGYEFIYQNGFWILEKEGQNFIFRYNPEEVERISGEVNYINSYQDKPLYIYSEDYVSEVEIYNNLGEFVQRFQGACFEEENCNEDLPIKDCSNNFIIIKEANMSSIIQEEGCVFIEGPKENLTKITDEFLFKILEI